MFIANLPSIDAKSAVCPLPSGRAHGVHARPVLIREFDLIVMMRWLCERIPFPTN